MNVTRLWFEDLAVGQVFEAGPVAMPRDRIVSFAKEFDPQAQHTDEEAARATPFGKLVASGWHTAAASMRLMHEAVIKRFGGGMGLGVDELRWMAPVLPGDVLRGRITITATRLSASRPGFGIVTMLVETLNQDGKPVMRMKPSSLVRCRE